MKENKRKFIVYVALGYGLILLLDLVLRSSFSTWPYHRSWEYMRRHYFYGGAFVPNSFFEKENVAGDLSGYVMDKEYHVPRKEVFSTDRYGYRKNAYLTKQEDPRIILFGDSFIVGAGVRDEETLSAQLSDLMGMSTYNAGLGSAVDFLTGYSTISSFSPDIIIVGILERKDYDLTKRIIRRFKKHNIDSWYYQLNLLSKQITQLKDNVSFWASQPSLRRWIIQSDRVFLNNAMSSLLGKNLSDSPVIKAVLDNDDLMLFHKPTIEDHVDDMDAKVRNTTVYLSELKKQCDLRGIYFLSLLIPEKHTIYQDKVVASDPLMMKKRSSTNYLDMLERSLIAGSIPCVNLSGPFQKRAEELYWEHEYIFWRDDTHWNAEGIRVAAEEIKRFLQEEKGR